MRLGLGIVALILATAAPALADDDDDILQVKQAFDPAVAEIAAGASMKFTNADDVNHNLVAVAPDGTRVDYGVEKPGDSTLISFPTAGVYSVICRIHPRMKMRVTAK